MVPSQQGDELIRCLADGGVALMATDTLPGLHARIDAPDAVARIQALKGRDAGKPLLVLAASLAAAAPWLDEIALRVQAYCDRCWPGPFTLVLPAAAAAPAAVTGGGTTLAVRVPAPEGLRTMLAGVGVPVVSTSANGAGEAPALTIAQAAERFGEQVDLIVAEAWTSPSSSAPAPSTLIDVCGWPPKVLRAGAGEAPGWRNLV